MGMPDFVFKALTNSWECVLCGVPNFSTGIFDTTLLDTSNIQIVKSASAAQMPLFRPIGVSKAQAKAPLLPGMTMD
ncbi:hypothetical protein DPMN_045393 [Dreissena polymorpha]|uniref:Uncharacterized protein n=1 Tax=Dreissena polymorpha TaxID=45954 RepID=A0A9D4D4Z6_DREPO|nr:hypothetical protein DPMN_045393 [Dreissena polymorpha]